MLIIDTVADNEVNEEIARMVDVRNGTEKRLSQLQLVDDKLLEFETLLLEKLQRQYWQRKQ
jgi:hypothetical protein